jgi:hypothetical protein
VIGILIAVLVAALVYIVLIALTGSQILALVAAIIVLVVGIPTHGYGLGGRFGGARAGGPRPGGRMR